ncbi:MAG: S8 family serine peptidase [Nitrospirales bacterium]|nr:S8 family serine peptidase [Nitrospirales bacterium]
MNYTMCAIFSVFLFSLTLGGSYILEVNQAVADGLPIVDIKAWADDAELTLPANQTRLQVAASRAHQGLNPLTYRWVKVSGPPLGEVTFLPNGNEDADITTATFRGNVAGIYTLRVIVSDGLQKESFSEVEVSINPEQSGARSGNGKVRVERHGGRKVMTRVDRVIIRFDIDTKNKKGPLRLSAASLAVMDSLGARVSKTWLEGRFGLVELAPGVNYRVALERLQALPEIRYAVADQSIKLDQYVPNDSQFDAQWGLKNTAGVDIRATFAWDQTTGNAHSLVAVMDTGIDYTHPDLYLAIAINNGEIPTSLLGQLIDTNSNGLIDFYDLNSRDANGDIILDENGAKFNQALVSDHNGNGYIDAGDLQVPTWSDQIDGDGNGYVDDLSGWNILSDSDDPMDTHGHGTHVTGIIAGRGDNGIGIAGVNWRTQILPVRFHDGGGGSISDAIQAIEYAVLLSPDVINASWGTVIDNPALKEAVQWAGDNGVVFVAAAGNGSNNIGDPAFAYYPAAYNDLTNLISVASVDPSGSLSSFSNYGFNTVDLAAPGASILSTGLGGSYVLWSGTSMGVAYVSGTVSLLAGLFPDKEPDWLVNRVLSTVKTLPDLEFKTRTGGMLDAFSAVNTPSLAGPRIVIANPIGDVLVPIDRVFLTFDSAMSAQTFTTDDIEIVGPTGSISPTAVNKITDFIFEVVFPMQATVGTYTLHLGPEIQDNLGRPMDQDRDGIVGEPLHDRFTVVFRLLPPPTALILDDGEAGYSASGGWTTYTGVGTQGDFAYKAVGSGTETATWTLSGLLPGQYQVAVTWQSYTNRALDARYTVLDGAMALGTVTIDQRQAPVGLVENGVLWQDIGMYQLVGDTLVVRLSDQAGPAGSYVIADAVRVERVEGLVISPVNMWKIIWSRRRTSVSDLPCRVLR